MLTWPGDDYCPTVAPIDPGPDNPPSDIDFGSPCNGSVTISTPAPDWPRFTCCRVRIDGLGLDAAAGRILDSVADKSPRSVFLCNAFNLSLASRDATYRDILNRGWLNLADGWPVRAVSQLRFRSPITEAPSGSELLLHVWQQGAGRDISHGFLGSDAVILGQLKDALTKGQDRVEAITLMDPLINSSSIDDLVEAAELVLQPGQPQIVWVGLGTPKQDQFIDALQARVPGLYVAVGAAFDFASGNKRRAPLFLRRLGLEWLHRLVTEPRRLCRRYFFGNAWFLFGLARHPPRRTLPSARRDYNSVLPSRTIR